MKAIHYTEKMQEATQRMSHGGIFLNVAGKNGEKNTMTIGWGAIGFYWGKPVFTVVVRPARHSYALLKETGEFTVSVPLDDALNKALLLCGTKSGRDGDKFALAGITTADAQTVGAPIIAECALHYECKVRLVQDMTQEHMDPTIVQQAYPQKDFHTMFFGEITACYLTK